VPQSSDIARLRREVSTDPRSLRFVQLGEALRREGYLGEAEAVLERGLSMHPGLNSARLVQSRLWADTGRGDAALAILDELYPRDSGNVRLVSLYLRLLLDAGRNDEARILLDRADMIGVPEAVRSEIAARLDEALWEQPAGFADDTWPPAPSLHPLPDDPSAPAPVALPTPPTTLGPSVAAAPSETKDMDPFATPVVALRLERAGRLTAALGIWEGVAEAWPDRVDIAARVADLGFRIDSGAETLQGELMAFGLPSPPPDGARRMLLRWRTALAEMM
jgi:tetratricopeptide (TPR) repeat protein